MSNDYTVAERPTRHHIEHRIGDVTVTLELPAGCPVPSVQLTTYPTSTTREERAAAIEAFGLTAADRVDFDYKDRGDGHESVWLASGDHLASDGCSVTVHLDESDVDGPAGSSIVPPEAAV